MNKKTLTELLGVVTIVAGGLALGIWVWLSNFPGSASVGVSAPAPLVQDELIEQPTATPFLYISDTAESIEITPSVSSASQVPMCVFNQQIVPPTAKSMLDNYVLSIPQIVLTSESAIDIVGWLPDGQKLLITRLIPEQARHYIETFDVTTQRTVSYGESIDFSLGFNGANKPIWLENEHAVAYVDYVDKQKILYLSYGDSVPSVTLADDIVSIYLAVNKRQQEIFYFSSKRGGQPQLYDLGEVKSKILAWDLHLPTAETPNADYYSHYQIALHPHQQQVVFYNDAGFYWADLVEQRLCEIDLGQSGGHQQWSLLAKWSPNGRYLAIFTTVGDLPLSFIHLTVMDMVTGEQYPAGIEARNTYALAWAPNSRDMLVIAKDETNEQQHKLYLADAISGKNKAVLQDYLFMGSGYWGVAWSSENDIALSCNILRTDRPLIAEGRLCHIKVGHSK